eukprot:3080607-Prymnesium_polylepis.1
MILFCLYMLGFAIGLYTLQTAHSSHDNQSGETMGPELFLNTLYDIYILATLGEGLESISFSTTVKTWEAVRIFTVVLYLVLIMLLVILLLNLLIAVMGA